MEFNPNFTYIFRRVFLDVGTFYKDVGRLLGCIFMYCRCEVAADL
jgi:hypothetical protein